MALRRVLGVAFGSTLLAAAACQVTYIEIGSNLGDAGTGTTSSTSSSTGGPSVCSPGATASCYDGPSGTAGVGTCKPGTKTCAADASWGACVGEVLPQPADCTSGKDLHCDGQVPSCKGSVAWARSFGDPSAQTAPAIATDPTGNVVLTGGFSGSIDFGGPADALVSAGSMDVFVASLDANGAHRWSRRFGSGKTDQGTSVAVDAAGNVLLAGTFFGTIDLGGGTPLSGGTKSLTTFIAKLSADGSHVWSKAFAAQSAVLAVDANGNLVVGGSFQTSVDFGCGTLSETQGATPFVARLTADGACLWSQSFATTAQSAINAIAVDASGNILLTGALSGSVDFGGGPRTSAGGVDAFVAELSSTGGHLWSKAYGDALDQFGASIAADPSGNVLVTGTFGGSIDFGSATPLFAAAAYESFLAKLEPLTGAHVWSRAFDTGSALDDSNGRAVGTDASGSVLLAGGFQGTIDFTGGTDPLPTAGGQDVFLAKLDPGGAGQAWSGRYGSANDQWGTSLAVDPHGNVLLAGLFYGSLYFGPPKALISTGGSNLFVARFLP